MIKKLLPYLSKCKRDIWLSVLSSTGESLFSLLIPLVMAAILDKGIGNSDLPYTMKMGALMVGMALITGAIGVLSAKYAARASMTLGAELRTETYQKLQSFTFRDIEKFGTGSLITRLTVDVTVIQNAAVQTIKQLVRCPSMLIFSIMLSFFISPKLALLFIAMMPLVTAAVLVIMIKIGPMYKIMQESTDKLNLATQENLIGMSLVKAFVRRNQQKERFEKENDAVYRSSDRAMGFSILTMPSTNIVLFGTTVALFWIGGNYVMGGTLTVGELTALSVYLTQILGRIVMIANYSIMFTRSFVSIRRILEVIDTEPDIIDGPSGTAVASGDICLDNVSFRYGTTGEYVLRDVNVDIHAGETIGILGGTGSAKTTLVQLIPRLYDVSEGRVTVGGRDVREYTLKNLRRSVSIVLQQNVLFSGSVRDNLLWGNPDATQEEMEQACRAACALEFIQQMEHGFDSELGQGGCNVSGGQKQRLCIARSIMKKPRVLILDDSTSAVDMATDAQIRNSFKKELPGITKIIIAQRIASVVSADRIIVLDEGKIAAVGNHEELMRSCKIYQEICDTQKYGEDEARYD